ncbi:MAG: DNA-binding protein [Prevotella sp.]|nr:DNA-binding protein [Prevotella sp.]
MVNYILFQEKRQNAKEFGKWYGRAVHSGVVNMKQLSLEIEENVSVKESDVYAVIKEMVRTMKRHMQNSQVVVIEDLGRFKIGINTKPATTAKTFSAQKNIVGSHVLFMPETHIDSATKNRTKALLNGVTFKEAIKNDVVKE